MSQRCFVFFLSLLPLGCSPVTLPVADKEPPHVGVTQPSLIEHTDYANYTGRTEAKQTIEVRSRVPGYLKELLFQDGAEIAQDTPMFLVDPEPFEIAVQKAQAEIRRVTAQSEQIAVEVQRLEDLLKSNAVAQQDYEEAMANKLSSEAAVDSAKATLADAELKLRYTSVKAPITGVASRALVTPGNLIQADQTLLTTLVSVDPIYVYFSIDSPTLLKFREQVRQGKVLERSPGKIPVEMEMETQTGYPWKGIVEFAENRFDPATGTLELRAEFANPKPAQGARELSPGLFVRVRIPLGPPRQVLAIPDRCVQNDLVEQYVYVVDEKNQVIRRPVETGAQVESLRVIESGLAAGDRVIERGIQKVVPGVEVQIDTSPSTPPPGA